MKRIKLIIVLLLVPNFLFAQREIWGTVSNGGQFGHGYIFKTDSIGNNFQIAHHFDSINGKNPGALLAASGNKLYGLTSSGGQNNQGLFSGGVFYEYDLTTSTFTALQHFGANNTSITGVFPAGDGLRTLTEVSPGLIYGQLRGAYTGGVVFAFNSTNNMISTALTLPTFQGGNTNSTTGNRLEGTLYAAPDGYLYGTTYTNSQCPIPNPNLGSIIRIDPVSNAFSIRYLSPCNGTNGYQFDNQFASYNNKLYSVTKYGGANNSGVIYSFDPATSTYTNKHDFEGGLLGLQPATMVKAANGKFYGTAYGGTPEPGFPSGGGILYEFDPATDQFTKKLDFTYGNGYYMNVGPFPFSLMDGKNGKFYGATGNGIFEYNVTLNQTIAKGRFPIDMGWYSPATPSLTAVCRKPSYAPLNETNIILCEGTNFSLDLHSDNTESVVWHRNGTIDASQLNPTLSFLNVNENSTGIWTAELTNACGTTTTQSIHLTLPPEINIIQTNNSIEVANGGDSFQWIDCNTHTIIEGETNNTFTPSQNGSYAAVVTTQSCADTSACYSIVVLSINGNVSENELSLYPNPVNDILYLAENIQIQSVTAYNMIGQLVLTENDVHKINVSKLPQGLYFISVKTDKGTLQSKFIKK